MYRRISRAGRSSLGHKIMRTRGSLLRKIKLPLVANRFRLTLPLVVSTFKLTPFSNRMLTLVMLPSGGTAYLPSLSRQKIFSLTYFYQPGSPDWYAKGRACMTLVGIVRQYRKVSNFELFPGKGIQYARSAGSWARVTNKDVSSCTAVVYLPSGVRKVVSLLSIIVPGRAAALAKRDVKNTKSGYWRSFGRKPTVRGVAMNPVDHPHGGRTKALRYPRTPWGKTTKKK